MNAKHFFFLILLGIIISCSDDDSSTAPVVVTPESEMEVEDPDPNGRLVCEVDLQACSPVMTLTLWRKLTFHNLETP